ncbi:MAG: hypothetical protein Q4Q03_01745 [Bowdeniella nasicola]|nr:hypothetical protein [Bowdeniella nasicola]
MRWGTTMTIPYYTADDIRQVLSAERARALLTEALRSDFDPASDPARSNIPVEHGHLLLMPASVGADVGVKLVGVAPDNPAQNLPRIHALYVLFSAETLQPVAIMDGSVLTTIRTPAISAIAADALAASEIHHCVVFGSGPQAIAHVEALSHIRDISHFTLCARNETTREEALGTLRAAGFRIDAGSPEMVSDAQLVVCATSATTPLFTAELIQPGTCVVAMGTHEPTAREIPGPLFAGAQVVVEDLATARREAGDIVLAEAEGYRAELTTLRSLLAGSLKRDATRVQIFKGVGMSWQDAVVAGAIHRTLQQ